MTYIQIEPSPNQNGLQGALIFSNCILREHRLLNVEGFLVIIQKTLSLGCTLRENDRETRPVSQSCPKEVSPKDHVKALEGLCGSLMILPKEIKSLKARVYKLETIINVVTKKRALNQKHKDNTSGKQCDLGNEYWIDENGIFFAYIGSLNPSANEDAVNDLVDALDDLVDENDVVDVDTYLSQDDFVKVQKL
nr:phospholipase-like protein [Tanacetum cinerariifolium]